MTWRSLVALAAGLAALVWIALSVGLANIVRDAALAGWALPAMAGVHLTQLLLAGLAWRISLGGAGLSLGGVFHTRWVREGVNALLPVAQIGGQVVGARLLVRRGLAPVLATAGTILDLTIEACAQLVFTLGGILLLLAVSSDRASMAPTLWNWIGGGVALSALGVAAFIAVQRLGGLRLVEAAVTRLVGRYKGASAWSMDGLHAALMVRQADRGALFRATVLHTCSWVLGGGEVWFALMALGHQVSLADAVVIECLGMVARTAGFAVPGALGVQEGGFVLVCGLFGVPAESAVALSVLKRLREVLVGLPALVAWHFAEKHAPTRSLAPPV